MTSDSIELLLADTTKGGETAYLARNRLRDHTAALEKERDGAQTQLETAQHEVAKMDAVFRVIVPEVMARLLSSCVWCGEASPEGLTAEGLSEHIRQHLATCQKHPIRAVENDLTNWRQCAEERQRAAEQQMTDKHAAIQERDAALADNAALRAQAVHGYECRPPYPSGCRCALAKSHPGAALLEEHRKALVRARNEGLEEAAIMFDREANAHAGFQWGRTCTSVAARIRAMIKPIPCCERDHDGDGNCDRHPRTAP